MRTDRQVEPIQSDLRWERVIETRERKGKTRSQKPPEKQAPSAKPLAEEAPDEREGQLDVLA